MEELLRSTTAYKILAGDRRQGRLSHAYMLHFCDSLNLRAALKIFAAEFFGAEKGSAVYRRIQDGNFTDFTLYPDDGKKIAADGIGGILDDCALKPVEGGRKLYAICNFETASALVQNKLLKTLEEPQSGIHFLLGATALAPVLDTVLSRVKLLEIPPFSESEIYGALQRERESELNAAAAKSANGCLGAAQSVVRGGYFKEIYDAAERICGVKRAGEIGEIAAEYGDFKYKQELLAEIQRQYFEALTCGTGAAAFHSPRALVEAIEYIDRANADLKFNAFFQGLLYDLMLKTQENGK